MNKGIWALVWIGILAPSAIAGNLKLISHRNAIPNSYIVELNPISVSNLDVVARAISAQYGGRIPSVGGREAIFKNAFQAFGLEMSPRVAARVAHRDAIA